MAPAKKAVEMSEEEIVVVSKLSVKNGGVSAKRLAGLPETVKNLPLCVIMGEADGTKQVDDPIRGISHFPLTGRFQAVNSETGIVTRSGVLYLPTGIHETFVSQVNKLQPGETVRFAVEVRAVRATNPAGYSYEVVNLVKSEAVDPMDELLAQVREGGKAHLKALPAASK